MKLLDYIFKIHKLHEVDEISSEVGVIDKKIGSTYFVKPINESYKAISMTIVNDRILNIGLSLKEKYDLNEFKEEIGISPSVAYNNYDECTVINFPWHSFMIMIKLKGHINLDSNKNVSFDELDIRSVAN